jgi:hypothetical protein
LSVEAMTWVFRHSPYTLGTRLVHLAIADVVNDTNGWLFWGADAGVADKAKVSRGTVVSARQKMIEDGYLEVVEEHRGAPSVYRFLTPGVSDSEQVGVSDSEQGCAIDGAEPARLTDSDHLLTQGELKRSRRRPETPFPEGKFPLTDAMVAWALDTSGFDRQATYAQTARFKDHALTHDRRCRDWVAAWRSWIRKAPEMSSHNGNGGNGTRRQPDDGWTSDSWLDSL